MIQVIPVIVLATVVVFGLQQLMPGDPAIVLAGENPTPEHIQEVRQHYGLDKPLVVQYATWLSRAAHGDLSRSLLTGTDVVKLIEDRMPATLLIAFLALVLAVVTGVPLGIAAAVRPGSALDRLVSALASLGVALPTFWLSMILVTIFALRLQWFPATGAASLTHDPLEALRHAALPAIALAGASLAEIAQQLRSALIEVLSSQYVRTLRAKGLSSAAILWRHGLKNVSVTLVTVIGLMANRLLGGTVVIEAVFAVPGIGSLIAESARNNDFVVIQGVVLVMVFAVIIINLAVDIVCSLLDPRISQR
jgi:peptide/nickel transport system permease protein